MKGQRYIKERRERAETPCLRREKASGLEGLSYMYNEKAGEFQSVTPFSFINLAPFSVPKCHLEPIFDHSTLTARPSAGTESNCQRSNSLGVRSPRVTLKWSFGGCTRLVQTSSERRLGNPEVKYVISKVRQPQYA